MDEHRQPQRWLLHLTIIATLATCTLEASFAAEPDTLDVPGGEAVEPTDTIDPAGDTPIDDPDSGTGLTLPAAKDTSGSANAKDGDGAENGAGLAPPKSVTDSSSPSGDKAFDDAAKEQLAWDNFAPPPDSVFDWIQLGSGEWLKGELKSIYDFKMEFDSDELGLLELDLEDVKQVRTARVEAVRFQEPGDDAPSTVYGILTVDEDTVTVGAGENARSLKRSDVISIAKGAERERDRWTGSLSLGANVRSGNSDLSDVNITARVERRRAISRYVAEYLGNFSSAVGIETSNNHRLTTYFDVFKSSRMYWRQVSLEYVRDKFRNIEHQANVNTGIGYDLVRSAKKDWDVTASVGGLYKRFVSVEPGNDIDNLSPSLSLGTRYDQEITKSVDFLFDYRAQIVDEENGSLIHHMLTTVSTEFISDLDFDVTFIWDRVRIPQPEADGTVPSQDDFQMIFGIGYDF